MQCKCGANADNEHSVLTKVHARFDYMKCDKCFRVSSGELRIRGVLVMSDSGGAHARNAYNLLEEQPELANELYLAVQPCVAPTKNQDMSQQALF